MEHYVEITHLLNPKNNLEKELRSDLKSYHDYLLKDDSEVAELMADITKLITRLNEEHPRCKPQHTPLNFWGGRLPGEARHGRAGEHTQITIHPITQYW